MGGVNLTNEEHPVDSLWASGGNAGRLAGATVALLCALAILPASVGLSGCVPGLGESGRTEPQMLEYLEQKYDEPFHLYADVRNRYYYGSDKFIVYPEGEPDALALAYWDDQGEPRDTYVQARWSEELTRQLLPNVRQALGPDVVMKAYPLVAQDRLPAPDQQLPAFAEFLDTTSDCTVVIVVAVQSSTDAADIDRVASGLHQVYSMTESIGSDRFSVAAAIVDDLGAVQEHVRTAAVNNTSWQNVGDAVKAYVLLDSANPPADANDVVARMTVVGD